MTRRTRQRKEGEGKIKSLIQKTYSLHLPNTALGRSKIYSQCSTQTKIILQGLCNYLFIEFTQKVEFGLALDSKLACE